MSLIGTDHVPESPDSWERLFLALANPKTLQACYTHPCLTQLMCRCIASMIACYAVSTLVSAQFICIRSLVVYCLQPKPAMMMWRSCVRRCFPENQPSAASGLSLLLILGLHMCQSALVGRGVDTYSLLTVFQTGCCLHTRP